MTFPSPPRRGEPNCYILYMTVKHVAKKGKQAGQFVPCNAKVKCRNGGVHISSQTYKLVRKEYGDVTLATLSSALEKGVVSSTNQPDPGKTVPVFNKTTSQESFNKFLSDNGVRAEYDVRAFTSDHKLESTGEKESLYRVENIADFEPILKGLRGYDSPTAAHKASLTTLKSMEKDAVSYSVSNTNLQRIAQIAATPNLDGPTKKNFDKLCDVLEDYNFHTYLAYVSALHNKTSK